MGGAGTGSPHLDRRPSPARTPVVRSLAPGPLPDPLPPPGAAAELWLLREHHDADFSLLDPAERDRAARTRPGPARTAYAAAHTALRRLLGAYTGTPPASVRLTRDDCPLCGSPHGRPRLADRNGPHFSLSHAPGLTLLAFAATPVGVDVEAVPGPATVAAIARGLHPIERRELAALPVADRPAAFARAWARKEAYLKGLGTGLARPLHLDYVGTGPVAPPPPDPDWTLDDIPLRPTAPARTAALALLRGGDGRR
ncbi:4'-phosphopantetheinyl transferase superfamily protein [Streptacidiphilus sp. N1-12]|uniref:4'-phosphopantetheinyl transferase superfamily protein n=2 Tax=Streptacidiphilus alkalitolerans TaxID=3342712 RepID=A0ABV6WPU5_9ACTN